MSKTIPLTQKQVAIVDDEDYKWLSQWKWQAAWQPNIRSYYAVRTERKNGKQRTIMMHREIAKTPIGFECDHDNHNTLDNQKRNLINSTRSQNQQNRNRSNANSKTGVLGVIRVGKRFHAFVKKNNKSTRIGIFTDLEEAATAAILARSTSKK